MRSYSSLVSTMLGAHPQLYALPELNPFVAETVGELLHASRLLRPSAVHGLLRTLAELEEGKQTEQSIERARRWLNEHQRLPMHSLMQQISERVQPRVIIEKSPSTAMRQSFLQRLQRDFPQARMIHLTRHPRPTCVSIHRIADRRESAVILRKEIAADPERLWARAHRNILEAVGALPSGNCIRLRGEDFLGDHRYWLQQLSEWLDIEITPQDLDAIEHPEQSPYASIGPSNARFGNDPNFLRQPAFMPRTIEPASLEGPLPWRHEHERNGFSQHTKAIARRLGYQ